MSTATVFLRSRRASGKFTSGKLQATGYKLQATRSRKKKESRVLGKQSYRDLEVYQIAHQLAIEVHKMTLEHLPKYELYEEGSQVRRSSKAIPSAIVEGFGRKQYQQEFVRYLGYAIASCDETREHLELLYESGSLSDKDLHDMLLLRYSELGKRLYSLRQTVKDGLKSNSLQPTV